MNISSNQGLQRRMLHHRGLVEETEIWKETVHAKIKHRTVVKLPRKIYVINMGKNVKRWRLRFILSFHHVKISHLSSSSIIQSCGLCPGQTPHPSNDKCHDTASNCREAAKKNLCHKHGKKCKKVKISDRLIIYHLTLLPLFRAVGCVQARPPTHPMTNVEIQHQIVVKLHGKIYVINMGKNVKRWRFILVFPPFSNVRAVNVISWKFSQYYFKSLLTQL